MRDICTHTHTLTHNHCNILCVCKLVILLSTHAPVTPQYPRSSTPLNPPTSLFLFLFPFFHSFFSIASISSLKPQPSLARYGRYCSWSCLLPRLCLTARFVSICFHYQMLTLGLRLDLPVSGGLVEDDHHARSLEDGVFCHLVAVSVHVTFVYRRRHTFYPCAPLHICHVWWSALLTGPDSARAAFPHMLEIICD